MGARVLVVDDDPWILRMVSATLEKKGYAVDTAREGRQALERTRALRPDVIITDVMMPVMDGWQFVQQLRLIPELAMIPVIFLTALGKDESRLRQLGLGPDDYLAKPFRFSDLEKRVTRALATAAAPAVSPGAYSTASVTPHTPSATPYPGTAAVGAAAPVAALPVEATPVAVAEAASSAPSSTSHLTPSGQFPAQSRSTAMSGRLEQLGLSSLLVMFEMERKDGVLTLKDLASGALGRIFLRRGHVVSARIDARAELEGRASVYEMLTWTAGAFSFSAMEVDMEDTVKSSTTHLLMEGARLMDEANR